MLSRHSRLFLESWNMAVLKFRFWIYRVLLREPQKEREEEDRSFRLQRCVWSTYLVIILLTFADE